MKLLILNLCNYIDYPLGGQLAFVRNLISAYGRDAKLVGITTDKDTPIGKWTKTTINGIEYDFYAVAYEEKNFKRPLIPSRITSVFQLKPHIKNILRTADFDYIYVQAPESLFCIPDKMLSKTIMRMPGVENPLSISRYKIARNFQKLYDLFFMRKTMKVKYLFASADEKEISAFLKRGKGKITRKQLIKFPTRYNSDIYFSSDKTKKRKELGIGTDKVVYSTVGRLAWFKGWKLMLDAFKLVVEKEPDAHFFFIGDGEDRSDIENYLTELHLTKNVTLLGSRLPSVIADYLNASDVFVMGSFKEGWSTTLVEACACCVPCVVTDFSSAEEMVKDGINGYVLKGRSEKDFADAMIKATELPRGNVIEYNERYKQLAVNKIRFSIESEINK